jgi:alpha-ribazole phosphatase
MIETRIFLIRHGGTEDLRPGAFIGQADLPLSAAGAARMEAVTALLDRAPVAKVYTSPLARCLQSARIVAEPFGISPIPHDGLREVSLGAWEGLTFPEIAERFPAEAERMRREPVAFVHPGGESIARMAERAMKAWEEIAVRSEGEQVAVVGHSGVNRAILARLLDMPLASLFKIRMDCGSVTIIDVANRFPMVRLLNAVPGAPGAER